MSDLAVPRCNTDANIRMTVASLCTLVDELHRDVIEIKEQQRSDMSEIRKDLRMLTDEYNRRRGLAKLATGVWTAISGAAGAAIALIFHHYL